MLATLTPVSNQTSLEILWFLFLNESWSFQTRALLLSTAYTSHYFTSLKKCNCLISKARDYRSRLNSKFQHLRSRSWRKFFEFNDGNRKIHCLVLPSLERKKWSENCHETRRKTIKIAVFFFIIIQKSMRLYWDKKLNPESFY